MSTEINNHIHQISNLLIKENPFTDEVIRIWEWLQNHCPEWICYLSETDLTYDQRIMARAADRSIGVLMAWGTQDNAVREYGWTESFNAMKARLNIGVD